MRYLELELCTMAPLRISNDDTSQHGQSNTLWYIPGSTIRGLVIHALCQEGPAFEAIKKPLFSDKIHFLNMYLKQKDLEKDLEKNLKRDLEFIPALKGFYEDKKACEGVKSIENVVVKGKVSAGTKRASLGHYHYPKGDCILCRKVDLGETPNINRGREGERTVFRNQYICQGQYFYGYITFDDSVEEKIIEKIKHVFSGVIYLGSNRSSGYGACACVEPEVKKGIPYAWLRTKADRNRFYLVLLSNMTMRNRYGQICGLDLDILAEKLGCGQLEKVRCAASVMDVMGYNRSWKGSVPSAVMYEAGSVFCLKTLGGEKISAERFAALEEEGLGIRRNEGFGQILFFDDYEKLNSRQWIEKTEVQAKEKGGVLVTCEEEPEDIHIAARGLFTRRLEREMERYIVEHPLRLNEISNSKLGIVQSLCLELQYVPGEAKKCLEDYIRHSEEKDARKTIYSQSERQDALHSYVRMMLEKDLLDILGMSAEKRQAFGLKIFEVLSEEDFMRRKLQLMIRQIRYANREARENED